MPTVYSDRAVDYTLTGDLATASVRVNAGERRSFVLADNIVEGEPPCSRVGEFLRVTQAFWEEWIDYCPQNPKTPDEHVFKIPVNVFNI